MLNKDLQDYRDQLENVIEQQGPYAHNLVSCILRCVAGKYGKAAANKLVAEYGLTDLFNIQEVK